MPRPDLPRIAVLGAGPVGLEAALSARALGFPVTVFERGRVAEYVQRWGHVRMFTPFGMNSTPLGRAAIRLESPKHEWPGETECQSGRDYVAAYLEPLAMTAQLIECLKLESQVVQIGRAGVLKSDVPRRTDRPFRLLVRENKAAERFEEADLILDCTGVYGSPCWLGDGGIPAVGEVAARSQLSSGLDDIPGADKSRYAGKTVLVVGAGSSAATQIVRLAELAEKHPEMWIVWLARSPRTQPLPRDPNDPLRERDRLAARANMLATRGEGNVEFHSSAAVDEVVALGPDKGFRVSARVAGSSRSWEVDRVIGCVGYMPDPALTRELVVGELSSGVRTGEPNYYVLGAKSRGRDGDFLMRSGFDQVREVFSIITGRPDPFAGANPDVVIRQIGR